MAIMDFGDESQEFTLVGLCTVSQCDPGYELRQDPIPILSHDIAIG